MTAPHSLTGHDGLGGRNHLAAILNAEIGVHEFAIKIVKKKRKSSKNPNGLETQIDAE